jgi:hypothetical protein
MRARAKVTQELEKGVAIEGGYCLQQARHRLA